jgi:hypothetical protein
MKLQTNPVTDSPHNDAFEGIVDVYFQTQGYITSAGKWFWVWEDGKKQRGYQDIDVLAVNSTEAVIVSVTSNLDDKVNTKNVELLKKLKDHFHRVHRYLDAVNEYRWMVQNPRTVRYVVAYSHATLGSLEGILESLRNEGIETLSAKDILTSLGKHTNLPNLKIQNQLLRTVQLLGKNPLQPFAGV